MPCDCGNIGGVACLTGFTDICCPGLLLAAARGKKHKLPRIGQRRPVMQLGKLGVWAPMDVLSAAEGALFAQRVEGWGYAALWLPESRGRDVLVHSSWLLANTKSLIVAPGIANIYARDAMAMANGQRALAEQSGGRFLLGIGVSHPPMVVGLRGHHYGKPVAT